MLLRGALSTFLVGVILSLGAGTARAQGIDLALLPAEVSVSTGGQFLLELTLPDSSADFNGFELEVDYDDAVLSLVSNQEGPLVTGVCGNRFHVFNNNAGVFTVTDAFLCAGVRTAGPGVVYRLTFQAVGNNTITTVILRSAAFSDGGIALPEGEISSALVRIGDVTGIPGDGDGPGGRRLLAPYPNPFRSSVRLSVTAARDMGSRLEIYSISGRRVRTLSVNGAPTGSARVVTWDGMDERGRESAPGVYLVRYVSGDRTETRRVIKTG